jgi:hypothetical protein
MGGTWVTEMQRVNNTSSETFCIISMTHTEALIFFDPVKTPSQT